MNLERQIEKAYEEERIQTVQYLLNLGVKSKRVLDKACYRGNTEIINKCLELGVKSKSAGYNAVLSKNLHLIKVLHEHDSCDKRTTEQLLFNVQCDDTIDFLLSHNYYDLSTLDNAILNNNERVIVYLMKRGFYIPLSGNALYHHTSTSETLELLKLSNYYKLRALYILEVYLDKFLDLFRLGEKKDP